LSLATLAGIALNARSLDDAIQSTFCESDMDALFRMAMQCQIIDDVIDYREDLAAGLPSFLTASASLTEAIALTADAVRFYAPRAVGLQEEAGVFPLEAALHVLTLVTRLVVGVAQ
jgi:hypothetical protein